MSERSESVTTNLAQGITNPQLSDNAQVGSELSDSDEKAKGSIRPLSTAHSNSMLKCYIKCYICICFARPYASTRRPLNCVRRFYRSELVGIPVAW